MIKNTSTHLIFTSATKSEVPQSFLTSGHVFTVKALQSGAVAKINDKNLGWIWVVTGVGPEASKQAAKLISACFKASYVLNIGTCGALSPSFKIGEWVLPSEISDGQQTFQQQQRLPLLDVYRLMACGSVKDCYDKLLPVKLYSVDAPISRGNAGANANQGNACAPANQSPSDAPVNRNALRAKADPRPAASHVGGLTERPTAAQSSHDADIATVVDMEAFAQAEHFKHTSTSFHTLKMVTDFANAHTNEDYNKALKIYDASLSQALACLNKSWEAPSVIIPTYNRSERLLDTIESVIQQTLAPKELIIVDDGSTDNTENSVQALIGQRTCSSEKKKELPFPIRYLRSTDNKGVSWARNKGIQHATSNWICLLDSDDHLHPHKFEADQTFINTYPFYLIYQPQEAWIRNNKPFKQKKDHLKPTGWAWDKSLTMCVISSSGTMIHKQLFDWFGVYDEALPACEDYDLWIRMMRWIPIGLLDAVTVTKYGGHADQLSQKYMAMDRFRIDALWKLYQQETKQNERLDIYKALSSKLNILIKGAKKHENSELLSQYEPIAKQLVHETPS